MKRLQKAVQMYLADIGQQQAPDLGGKPATKKGKDEFRERLLEEQLYNRRIFSLMILLLTMLFAVGIYFVFRNRDQPITAGSFLGGEFLSLLLVIQWIRQVLLDKVYTDLLVRASNELDSEHLAKFVTTFYELTTKAHPQTTVAARRSSPSRT